MKPLVNAFSVLELDAEDDQVRALSTFSKDDATASSSSRTDKNLETLRLGSSGFHYLLDLGNALQGKSKKEVNISSDIPTGERQKQGQPDVPAEDYKLPLVWIDLEMTGLNVETDRILEIACIITNGSLTKLVEGPDLVIHQSKECLEKMGEWCQSHHAASGLTKKVLQSTISEREAEKQVIKFVKKHVGSYTLHLAGNSVYMDFIFLKKYMPDLAGLFSHVLVDVSSVKALCFRWFPRDQKKAPPKENKHRALDDIRESIMELKYYKENIFKKSKK